MRKSFHAILAGAAIVAAAGAGLIAPLLVAAPPGRAGLGHLAGAIAAAAAGGALVAAIISKQFYYQALEQLAGSLWARRLANSNGPTPADSRTRTDWPEGFDLVVREYNCLQEDYLDVLGRLEHAQALLEQKVAWRTENLQLALRQVKKTAQTDSLTGVVNRGQLLSSLEEMFTAAVANGDDLACLLIDIDRFKQVNDQLGHHCGDQVIVFLAELLRACTRDQDVSGRYGGDEFVVLLSGADQQQAAAMAERMRALFAREAQGLLERQQADDQKGEFAAPGGEVRLQAGLSIGIATLKQQEPSEYEELLAMADEALYRAKNAGRDCVSV